MRTMICPYCWGSKYEPKSSAACHVCEGTGVQEDIQLSPHFWLSEFVHSDTAFRLRIPNNPTAEIIAALKLVANELLEPLRAQHGPLHVDSGYRAPALNAALNGSSDTSVHPRGFASDIKPIAPGVTRKMLVDTAIEDGLPFDEVIFEGTWVHISIFAPDGHSVRRKALAMFPDKDGHPKYGPYDPNDPRIHT